MRPGPLPCGGENRYLATFPCPRPFPMPGINTASSPQNAGMNPVQGLYAPGLQCNKDGKPPATPAPLLGTAQPQL